MNRTVLMLVAMLAVGPACSKTVGEPIEPGQVWHYATRDHEKSSRATILKVETLPGLGNIVHVSLDRLHIKDPSQPGGVRTEVSHLAVEEQFVRMSLTKLSGHRLGTADMDLYDTWKRRFDAGQAAAWSLPLADTLAALEDSISRRQASR